MKINKKYILLFILIFAGMLIFATGTCSAVGKVWATKDRNIWTYDNGWHYTNTINYHNSVKRVQYKKYTSGGYSYYDYGKTKYTKKYTYKGKVKYTTTYRWYKQKVYKRYKATWTKKMTYSNYKTAPGSRLKYDKWVYSHSNINVNYKYTTIKRYAKQYY